MTAPERTSDPTPAIVVLSPGARDLGERAAAILGGRVHPVGTRFAADERVAESVAQHLIALFQSGRPIVAVMAAGALIRILAPYLADKTAEPGVVALSEDGRSAVPLLGGHHGANRMARLLAEALGGHAAVTTAGDVSLGLALDEPPAGYRLADPARAKDATARLLAGEPARVTARDEDRDAARDALDWLRSGRFAADDADGETSVRLIVSSSAGAAGPGELVYRPRRFVLGIGAERGAPAADAVALAESVLVEAGVAPEALAAVASIDLKADEPAVHAVAARFGAPARFFDAVTLEAERERLETPSEIVFAETGCHGVAEGAALAAVGQDGSLALAKRKGARVTAALGVAPAPLDPAAFGRSRGRLHVVGIGPGQAEWRSPEVTNAIAACDDLVGYSLYLDLLGPLAQDKTRHDFDLGREEARVRHAMELAGEGREVALVCSGDAGIYAMATLVFELLDTGGLSDGARRIDIAVAPGISALQGAAARVGAPLGHDFCTISLSDLLTPWPAIEARVKAAAQGDFVTCFYNPVSRKRRTQLAFARDELLRHRPPETPVVIATNLGRDGERVRIVRLDALSVGDVDMLTVVVVGSSQSRVVTAGDGRDWVYTPRGYAGKAGTGIASPPAEGAA